MGIVQENRLRLRLVVGTEDHYLISYQVNEAAQWIEVVRIWDGRQNPASFCLP